MQNVIDFRPWTREIEDQGNLGSCVANSEVSAIELITYRAHQNYNLSRLGLYHDTLAYENRLGQEGLTPVDALIVGSSTGVGDESLCQYDVNQVLNTPSQAYYADAATQKVTHYRAVALTKTAIDAELAHGNPVLIAADVPNWFRGVTGSIDTQNDSGHLANYGNDWYQIAGKHQFVLEGKNDTIDGGVYLIENSWGTVWGDNGIGAIKYDDIAYNKPMGYIPDGTLNFYSAYVIDGFGSMDFQHTVQREQVTELYISLFNRAPESGGLNYWASELNTRSFASVAQSMFDCDPSRATYPSSMTNSQIIGSFYSNVLGRTADAGGLNYWASHLDAGQTKGQVITDMIAAVDGYTGTDQTALNSKYLLDNKVAVGEYYAVTLQADNIPVAQSALSSVTADINLIGQIELNFSHQLGWT